MIPRDYLTLIFSIWLSLTAGLNYVSADRWSRQVSNSEWIPLANPRSQLSQTSASNQQPLVPPVQSLNFSPQLRQEYQQQLLQLQKTQDSIQKLLLVQQQLRNQQQLLQNQAYLPNVVGPDDEKQAFHQSAINNVRGLPELTPEILAPPQLSSDSLPSVYSHQEFRQTQPSQQGQYEIVNPKGPGNRDENYSPDAPSGSSNDAVKNEDDEEEIQVVYVPAETLAQRGQQKDERNRDHKQFAFPQSQRQQQNPKFQQQLQDSSISGPGEQHNSYNSELVQFPRDRDEQDQFLKNARQKELDRLNEERQEIQKQTRLQIASMQREHDRMRQREAEKKRKELAKIEEEAKQHEFERIKQAREQQKLEELERVKERAAKERQVEIDRLAALERQKKVELEKLVRKEEEERVKELENRDRDTSETSSAEHLASHHQQHLTETRNPHKTLRTRNKPRHRPQYLYKPSNEQVERSHEEPTTPPTPNQPPLAVFMGSRERDVQEVKIDDVLRVLRNAKTIAVLDQVAADAPKVFVGPSNLDPPRKYAKFELPYLSSLDTNRVERRVDKLPFFVAPLSFNPPLGYSKIPFPAPHIGSVIVNNYENSLPTTERLESHQKLNPNPVIEPNSFITGAEQGSSFQLTYQNPTTAAYMSYIQDHVTPQYETSSIYSSTPDERFGYRQQQYEQRPSHALANQEPVSASPYQEGVTASVRPNYQYSEESVTGSVTPGNYRRPTVVSSYSYEQDQISTTPAYENTYSHTRAQPNKEQESTSHLGQFNQHDYSQHRHVNNQYQHPSIQSSLNQQQQQQQQQHYPGSTFVETNPHTYRNQQYGSNDQTQYSLPAELPPIHPQLPGLVNSLIEQRESDRQVETTTTTSPAPTTTTTETPTTTYRIRQRPRGRVSARPTATTTTTTTSAPGTSKSQADRTRRPFNRSRSRYTTATEEYEESSYEPTRATSSETTQKSTSTDYYRRSTTPRIQKLKSRTNERGNYESSTLNQLQNMQSQESASDEVSSTEDSNNLRETAYSRYSVPSAEENPGNVYLNKETLKNPTNSFNSEIDYSKTPNYPRTSQNVPIQQQNYQDRSQSHNVGFQGNAENQPTAGIEYQINDKTIDQTPVTTPVTNDYYYQNKNNNDKYVSTNSPIYTHILEYLPGTQSEGLRQTYSSTDTNDSSTEKNSASVEDGQQYNQHVSQEPLQTTTEEILTTPIATTTTTTTTTAVPNVVIRQRVRARLGGRTRQESVVQTQPRGSQEEYVRFSAVNQAPGSRTSNSSSSRQRDPSRTRTKARPHHHQTEVQSEGNEYVRIQSSNRSNHPKTIVQAAATSPRTTTTTQSPLTTTESTSQQSDDIEYGFIRQPQYNQPQNQLSSRYRAPDSQIQLQNVAPTDETAEDSSPTLTQVPKHRQKYQQPNRPRPTIKSSLNPTTTTPPSVDPYTTKPRVRNEEPKNRIRIKGRRPGARKRPTTTSTTTEYSLDGNNNLPLDENYPRLPIVPVRSSVERHSIYDTSYEGSAQGSKDSENSRADYYTENYPSQNFGINSGETSQSEEQQDQISAQPARKHHGSSGHRHTSSGSRLRPYSSSAVAPERDIYGAESQWSTKLTKSSFQPSNVNQLNRDGEKSLSLEQESSEVKDDAPEIITAQPEEAFITVLVSSDDKYNKTKEAKTSEEIMIESTDFGQKMIPESSTINSESMEVSTDSPLHKSGSRKRRVRIRVRPAPVDDFVTAESQHINSAVNSLVQDEAKYNRLEINPLLTIETSGGNKKQSPMESTESSRIDESIESTDMTTTHYTESPELNKAADVFTVLAVKNEEKESTTIPETTVTEIDTTTSENPTTMQFSTTEAAIKKSWDSSNGYAQWFMKKPEQYFPIRQELNNEFGRKESIEENNKAESTNDSSDNYPKNHRSEWSEVRYPSNRGVFGYARSEVLPPTTQLPGFETKSVGDTSVKTLSDYVQAIFETMKNADEEREVVDNAPDLWQSEANTSNSTEISKHPTAILTAKENDNDTSISSTVESTEKNEESVTENDKIQEFTTTITKLLKAPSTLTTSNPSDDSTTLKFQLDTEEFTTIPNISTMPTELVMDQTPNSSTKNTTQTKLGAILRTSTTTKVSHMTEICYRGRCVMTKPRKDIPER